MSSDNPASGEVPYGLILKLYPDARAWEIWKPSWDDQRMEALIEIDVKQLQRCLPYLAPLVATGSKAVRNEAARVIARLLEANLADGLLLLSQGLHRLVHYETAAPGALGAIKRDTIWNLQVPSDFEWAVFGLLSFHGNGWVREAAIDRLSRIADGREIPFLLYRSNDWVDLVAKKAKDFLETRLTNGPVRRFSNHLAIIFQLRSRERGYLSDFQSQLLARLSREEEVELLERVAEQTGKPGFRRWLLALATSAADVRPEAAALSHRLRNDGDPMVRAMAWERIWKDRPEKSTWSKD